MVVPVGDDPGRTENVELAFECPPDGANQGCLVDLVAAEYSIIASEPKLLGGYRADYEPDLISDLERVGVVGNSPREKIKKNDIVVVMDGSFIAAAITLGHDSRWHAEVKRSTSTAGSLL
jgi:hypothetical protein